MEDPKKKKMTDGAMKRFSGLLGSDDEAEAPSPAIPTAFGRYRVVRLIAEGASGQVFEAEDLQLNRRVALKVLHSSSPDSFIRRFHREASLSAKLRHPGIVTVHEISMTRREDGSPIHFMVMDFYEKTLEDLLEDQDLEPRRAIELLAQVAEAIHYAHLQGIIHRDLKPANILIDREGRPVVSDFGLARQETEGTQLTRSGSPIGTPSYMSPEQAAGRLKEIGPRSDVYALGVILYRMITGFLPFPEETVAQTYSAILTQEPRRPRSIAPDVDADLETICMKAMDKLPDLRYEGAGPLAEDLRRHLAGEPIHAKPLPWWGRFRRRLHKNPWMWGGALVATAAVAALAITAIILLRKTQATSTSLTQKGAELDKTTDDLKLAHLATEISEAYLELSLGSAEALKDLEDSWRNEKQNVDVAARLAEVTACVNSVSAKHPDTKIAKGWLALALYFANKADQSAMAWEIALDSPDDPFPHILLVRGLLAAYSRETMLPAVILGHQITVAPYEENRLQVGARERMSESIVAALKCKVWAKLKSGREFLAYAEAVRTLGEKDYESVVEKLQKLKEYAFLRDEAEWMRGLALYLTLHFEEAAVEWESVGARRWSLALAMAGTARLSQVVVEENRGVDPKPACQKAIDDYTAVLKAHSSRPNIHNVRGIAYTRRGMFEQGAKQSPVDSFRHALVDLDEALRQAPDSVETLNNRGNLYHYLGEEQAAAGEDPFENYAKSIADLERAAKINPKYPPTYLNFGTVYQKVAAAEIAWGRDPSASCDRAIASFEHIIQLDPANFDGYFNRGRIHEWKGDLAQKAGKDPLPEWDLALADLDEAVHRKSDFTGLRHCRGFLLLRMADVQEGRGTPAPERFRKAVEDFTEALRINPGHFESQWRIAIAFERLGRLEESLAAFEKASKLQPDNQQMKDAVEYMRKQLNK